MSNIPEIEIHGKYYTLVEALRILAHNTEVIAATLVYTERHNINFPDEKMKLNIRLSMLADSIEENIKKMS